MKKSNGNGQQLAEEVPFPDPWTDAEFEVFAMQEPLPPNQGFQLPAEEFPSDDNNENQPYLIHT